MFALLMLITNPDRLVTALVAAVRSAANPMRLFEAALGIKLSAAVTPLRARVLAVVAEAGQPTSAVTVFGAPLGVKFLAIVVLLLFAIVIALAVGCLFKVGLKAPWKHVLPIAGAALGATFGMGYLIMIYLMPPAAG